MSPETIGSILFGLALIIVVGLFLARPFFKAPEKVQAAGRRQQLAAQKAGILEAIRALDFDHDTGKLPDQEYEQQRAALMNDAATILKELDTMPAGPQDEDIYAQIEAAVSTIRQQRAGQTSTAVQFCTACGQGLDADDNFCPRCGQPAYTVQPST